MAKWLNDTKTPVEQRADLDAYHLSHGAACLRARYTQHRSLPARLVEALACRQQPF
jgi:hypothetical protein